MDQVELTSSLRHPAHHQHEIGDRVADGVVEPQRDGNAWRKLSGSNKIAAGEQRHIVSEANEFFRKVRDYPLGSAVKARWNTLTQRRDLRDSHGFFSERLRHVS